MIGAQHVCLIIAGISQRTSHHDYFATQKLNFHINLSCDHFCFLIFPFACVAKRFNLMPVSDIEGYIEII